MSYKKHFDTGRWSQVTYMSDMTMVLTYFQRTSVHFLLALVIYHDYPNKMFYRNRHFHIIII